jgi:hypothetical protein
MIAAPPEEIPGMAWLATAPDENSSNLSLVGIHLATGRV